jgi:hypothetical protein
MAFFAKWMLVTCPAEQHIQINVPWQAVNKANVRPPISRHARAPQGLPVFIVEETQQTKIREAVPELRNYMLRGLLAPLPYGVISRFYLHCGTHIEAEPGEAVTRRRLL